MDTVAIRRACREYAQRFIDIQREEFQRLGVGGLWTRPYVTMGFAYESEIARALRRVLRERSRLPGISSPCAGVSRTRPRSPRRSSSTSSGTDPAIYVAIPSSPGGFAPVRRTISGRTTPPLLIWTTTPWTIPSNVAIAVHPDETYAWVHAGDRFFLVADRLVERVAKEVGWTSWNVLTRHAGEPVAVFPVPPSAPARDARRAHARGGSPFLPDRHRRLRDDGRRHRSRPHGAGPRRGRLPDRQAREPSDPLPRRRGRTLHDRREVQGQEGPGREHGDRRGPPERRRPARRRLEIPRTTIRTAGDARSRSSSARPSSGSSASTRRAPTSAATALEVIREGEWMPAWGEQRIAGMVENRREWVISRQRRWGSPITLLYAMKDGERARRLSVEGLARRAEEILRPRGRHLPRGRRRRLVRPSRGRFPAAGRGPARLRRADFEKERTSSTSGSTPASRTSAVLRSGEWPRPRPPRRRPSRRRLPRRPRPAPRLVPVVAADVRRARSATRPTSAVITHGFVVGRIGPEDVEVSRERRRAAGPHRRSTAPTSSGSGSARSTTGTTTPISEEILARCAEAYRKIRNTARYRSPTSSTSIRPGRPTSSLRADLLPLDRWVLGAASELAERIREAYEGYEFHVVYHQLVNLCATTLSALYLDVVKDRLYASAPASRERRSAQTALHRIGRVLATAPRSPVPVHARTRSGRPCPGRRKNPSTSRVSRA